MKPLPFCLLFAFAYVSNLTTTAAQEALATELQRIESYIDQRDLAATDVSTADVAWHLDHALKVMLNVYEALEASDTEEYSYAINPVRAVVFATGRIPRGVAKSPASVTPPDDIRTEDILTQLGEARDLLPKFYELEKRRYYEHFVFGKLNSRRATKFVLIHTRHHLRIIEDIVKAAKRVIE